MMLGGLVTATDRRFRVARATVKRDEPEGQSLAGEPAR
jgi:hypothetical protein